jgi:hypothetical protein
LWGRFGIAIAGFSGFGVEFFVMRIKKNEKNWYKKKHHVWGENGDI